MQDKLIDSHCHLPSDSRLKLGTILDSAKECGVVKFINIGTSLKDSQNAITIAEYYDQVYATVGIYPHEDQKENLKTLENEMTKLIKSSPKIVAIGECGIDTGNWENPRPPKLQLDLFEMQIKLAMASKLPLIIHNRNGDKYVVDLLEKYVPQGLFGVAHCFSQDWSYAQKLLDFGFYISFSGMITYPSRKALLETVQKIPLDHFLIETDAPYLPPRGHRGEENQPKYVKIIAEKVAQVKQKPFEAIAQASYSNTCRLFAI